MMQLEVQDIDEEFELGELDPLGAIALACGILRQARRDVERANFYADDAMVWLEGRGRGLALALGVEYDLDRWMREVGRPARAAR